MLRSAASCGLMLLFYCSSYFLRADEYFINYY